MAWKATEADKLPSIGSGMLSVLRPAQRSWADAAPRSYERHADEDGPRASVCSWPLNALRKVGSVADSIWMNRHFQRSQTAATLVSAGLYVAETYYSPASDLPRAVVALDVFISLVFLVDFVLGLWAMRRRPCTNNFTQRLALDILAIAPGALVLYRNNLHRVPFMHVLKVRCGDTRVHARARARGAAERLADGARARARTRPRARRWRVSCGSSNRPARSTWTTSRTAPTGRSTRAPCAGASRSF